jgi:hypothetical protein
MLRPILGLFIITGFISCLACAVVPEAGAATQSRAKAKRAVEVQPSRTRVAVTPRAATRSEPITGQTGLRDRSTFYQADGRINGREFFDQLQERSNGMGQ